MSTNVVKIIGLEDSADCSKCGNRGAMVDNGPDGYGRLKMVCGQCSHKWWMLPRVCPDCGESNGFPVEGLCSGCYGLKRLR